ncbi:hypothetical protein IMZ31_23935 (plasmid) [Pontibacillus sp. ALD_SL1]|uniref:hypothetical protein n=1 Tax=Pontibacillus sp. ALD_SL1 TaxID=2777185 RepID=UPI001A9732E9|nr:hypothetical protein [Pontibacillus sp. ALD_SL1]QST02504.1 hypothetical protein IMZ31_23935 [Pontibacillus sp. ALD_SL1]
MDQKNTMESLIEIAEEKPLNKCCYIERSEEGDVTYCIIGHLLRLNGITDEQLFRLQGDGTESHIDMLLVHAGNRKLEDKHAQQVLQELEQAYHRRDLVKIQHANDFEDRGELLRLLHKVRNGERLW